MSQELHLKCIPCHSEPAVLFQVEVAYFQLEVSNFSSTIILAKHKTQTQNVMEGGDCGGYTTPVKGSDNESNCDDVPNSVVSEEDRGEAQDNEKGEESSSSAHEKGDSACEKEGNAAAEKSEGAASGSCAADEEGSGEEGNASESGVRKRRYVKQGLQSLIAGAEPNCWTLRLIL